MDEVTAQVSSGAKTATEDHRRNGIVTIMHPLLETTRVSVAENPAAWPDDAEYDLAGGVWKRTAGGDDPYERPVSKKFDVETGEDQKGQ